MQLEGNFVCPVRLHLQFHTLINKSSMRTILKTSGMVIAGKITRYLGDAVAPVLRFVSSKIKQSLRYLGQCPVLMVSAMSSRFSFCPLPYSNSNFED